MRKDGGPWWAARLASVCVGTGSAAERWWMVDEMARMMNATVHGHLGTGQWAQGPCKRAKIGAWGVQGIHCHQCHHCPHQCHHSRLNWWVAWCGL